MTAEKTEKPFAYGYNFYKIFWIFFIFCIVGDLIEVVFCRFSMGRWMSRSSLLYGPFSIVWGFGGVMLTILLRDLARKRDMYIFLSGTILGGVYEYLCSLLAETVFGVRFWDYSKYSFNIQGRINLQFCFFWGLIALVWVKDIYPRVSRWIEKIPKNAGTPLTWVLVVFMSVNMLLSASALIRFGERQETIAAEGKLDEFLDEHYPDEWMIQRYSNMKLQIKTPSGETSDVWKSPYKAK